MASRRLSKEREIMEFLRRKVFFQILLSPFASEDLKKGVMKTIEEMEKLDAAGMIQYYWTAIIGTEESTEFARRMRNEGYTRFEDVIDEFRERFNDHWLKS